MATSSLAREPVPSLVHLDMARGLAALFVFLGHLRGYVFYSYDQLATRGPLEMALWAVTGLGHQAVMLFFVLSGFVITRSILRDDRLRKFSWKTYLIKRLSRLWVVLVPCLIMTLVWDSLGISLSGRVFYEGQLYSTYNSGPNLATGGADLSLSTLIRNLFFLQTIVGPTFGSNGPLWSLANEFWYYLLFPLLYVSITRQGNWLVRAVNASLLIVVCAFVGPSITFFGLIWLAGALSYLMYDRGWLAARLRTSIVRSVTIITFLAALALSKMNYGNEYTNSLLIGLAAAGLVLVLANCESGSALYRRTAHLLASASYTIYLAHFPFLALIASVVLRNQKFPNSVTGYAVFAAIGAATLIYCYGVYWLFERHTAEVRQFCLVKFGGRFERDRAFGVTTDQSRSATET